MLDKSTTSHRLISSKGILMPPPVFPRDTVGCQSGGVRLLAAVFAGGAASSYT
jgi:hypothetical protein